MNRLQGRWVPAFPTPDDCEPGIKVFVEDVPTRRQTMSDITYLVQTGKGVKGSYTLVADGMYEGEDAEVLAKERYTKVKIGPGEKKRLMKAERGKAPETVEQDLSRIGK